MSVKKFKFVSPGVFINEIDNSFIPTRPDAIGPVVIGRARRGLAMQPVKVEAYSDFVEMFGDTVSGFAGGDIYRDGNYQSPMYGTYAAKAFLNAGVAPLTYIRLLGQQDTDNDGANDARAGWKTLWTAPGSPTDSGAGAVQGGAYGLWVWPSGSTADMGAGSLAAIWYINDGEIALSGNYFLPTDPPNITVNYDTDATGKTPDGANTLVVVGNHSTTFDWTVCVSGSKMGALTSSFTFDDSSSNFIRKKFNTNPQLISGSTFYSDSNDTSKDYWLGESFEHQLRNQGLIGNACHGAMIPFYYNASTNLTPANMKNQASKEAVAGWFIGQDLGTPSSYIPFNMQKLFRLIGRGHGEWLQKKVKVSISNIRASSTTVTEYGTFSVILRSFTDTDSAVEVLERYDQCSLDPTSPDFVARKIGDKYTAWIATDRTLTTYGEYDNNSKFVYVEMNADVEAGATDATLLPAGYFGPPRFTSIVNTSGSNPTAAGPLNNFFLSGGVAGGHVFPGNANTRHHAGLLSGVLPAANPTPATEVNSAEPGVWLTGTFNFPSGSIRLSASDGGLSDPRDAYFGFSNTRDRSSTVADNSTSDMLREWYAGFPTDPTTESDTYLDGYSYVFSLDDVAKSSNNTYYYQSGSRVLGTSQTNTSYTTLLDAGYDSFTAPFFGGADGFDIMKPDPLYNLGMGSAATNLNSYAYYTYKRAIDTVADPEFLNMNLLAVPGLTHDGLTKHMINVSQDRADTLAVIDLPSVYIPPHEAYYSSKADRIGTTPTTAATSLRDRRIDSSYGTTFYPWVQTRDDNTGRLLWIPPTVAMMGVMASSEARSELWFAPAGFNRGGLSQGAAGIPVTGVTQRLTSKERDTLYENNINPIASFPSNGIVVFGQKTLQARQSALDRINVRRLVIYLKKQISILSTKILFEQNVQATWNRFISMVEPFLANVKVRFGITDYKLILDESTTTPDLIDQNILYAKIMIKPARAIEYIAIDFVIMSTGASFED